MSKEEAREVEFKFGSPDEFTRTREMIPQIIERCQKMDAEQQIVLVPEETTKPVIKNPFQSSQITIVTERAMQEREPKIYTP